MFKFNHAMFCESHMSHYSEIDINCLKEYRTTVPMGFFKQGNLKHLKTIGGD